MPNDVVSGSNTFGFRSIRPFGSSLPFVVSAFVYSYYHVSVILIFTSAGQCRCFFFHVHAQFVSDSCSVVLAFPYSLLYKRWEAFLGHESLVYRVPPKPQGCFRLFHRSAGQPHAKRIDNSSVRDESHAVQQFAFRHT